MGPQGHHLRLPRAGAPVRRGAQRPGGGVHTGHPTVPAASAVRRHDGAGGQRGGGVRERNGKHLRRDGRQQRVGHREQSSHGARDARMRRVHDA